MRWMQLIGVVLLVLVVFVLALLFVGEVLGQRSFAGFIATLVLTVAVSFVCLRLLAPRRAALSK